MTNVLNLGEQSRKELNKCDTFDFNIFRLRELSDGRELEAIHAYVVTKRGCFVKTKVDINKLLNFNVAIQGGYKNITYHNKTHAADLCQSINMFLTTGDLGEMMNLDAYEYLAIYTAAICHDFEHPGVNNVFLQHV